MAKRLFLLLAAFLGCAAAASGETLPVTRDALGGPVTISGEFVKPAGSGPFAAVIVLHNCAGLTDNTRRGLRPWLDLLYAQNYAALTLDSFTARHVTSACDAGRIVPGAERAKDLLAAADVLATRSDIRPDKIGAIGFSHGGWTAVYAATAHPDLQPWRDTLASHGKLAAIIGLYPACADSIGLAPMAPLLILIGEKDDWTPARPCVALGEQARNAPLPVRVKVYPDAVHLFDVNRPPSHFGQHSMAYDPAAAADARDEVTRFFAQYLN